MTRSSRAHASGSDARARFGLVGACSLALVIWIIGGPRDDSLQLGGALLLANALFLLVVWSTRPSPRAMRTSIVGAIAVSTLACVSLALDTSGVRLASLAIVLAVGLACPVLLGIALVKRRSVDLQLLLGAISMYLMFGLSFAMAYAILGDMQREPLFITPDGRTDGALDAQVYFSFITMSTTGYGDYTPSSGTARALAVLEALGGQLYLLTTVAAIVGLLTNERAGRDRA